MTTATERIVFEGPAAWWKTIKEINEVVVGPTWTGDWKRAAAAAGLDTNKPTAWVAPVEHVAERHTAIRVGDYACFERDNKPIKFVRLG